MAVVAPVLLLILFGIIEFGWIFTVQETVTSATREACRTASLPGATDQEIRDRFKAAMGGTNVTVTDGMIAIDHATEDDPVVTINTSIPYSQVTITGMSSFLGFTKSTLNSTCSMQKEGM